MAHKPKKITMPIQFLGIKIPKKRLFSIMAIIFSLALSLKFIGVMGPQGGLPVSYSITALIVSLITTHAISIHRHRKMKIEVNFSNLFYHRLPLYITALIFSCVYAILFYYSSGISITLIELLFMFSAALTFGSIAEEVH